MTPEQSIKILNEQIQSLASVTISTHETWLTQTKSEIRKIFGIGSEESLFLISFKLINKFSHDPAAMQLLTTKKTAYDFLKRCIESIERSKKLQPVTPNIQYIEKQVIKEVVKEVMVYPPKINHFVRFIKWIKRQDILSLIGTGIVILGLPFGLAWLLATNKGEIKNFELNRENNQLKIDTAKLGTDYRTLLDSIRKTTPFNVPNNKTESDAKRNKQKGSNDTTHK